MEFIKASARSFNLESSIEDSKASRNSSAEGFLPKIAKNKDDTASTGRLADMVAFFAAASARFLLQGLFQSASVWGAWVLSGRLPLLPVLSPLVA